MAEFDFRGRNISGRQACRLDVPGTDSAVALSVVSFEATEKIGAPTEVRIVLTHPFQLARSDYLNFDATRAGIRRLLSRGGIEDYQGKLIHADPTGRNLVFPSGAPPHMASIDRGWSVELMYSTDGGKTFHALEYMPHSFDPFEDSKDYAIYVTQERMYVEKRREVDSYVVSYPLLPGFVYDGKSEIPDNKHVEEDTEVPGGVNTPSGDGHIHCDASIKPTNPDAPLTRNP